MNIKEMYENPRPHTRTHRAYVFVCTFVLVSFTNWHQHQQQTLLRTFTQKLPKWNICPISSYTQTRTNTHVDNQIHGEKDYGKLFLSKIKSIFVRVYFMPIDVFTQSQLKNCLTGALSCWSRCTIYCQFYIITLLSILMCILNINFSIIKKKVWGETCHFSINILRSSKKTVYAMVLQMRNIVILLPIPI